MIKQLFHAILWLVCFNAIKTQGQDNLKSPPMYPGGMDSLLSFIRSSIQYPEASSIKGEEGIVVLEFIIDRNGETKDVSIYSSVSEALDQEALRVVSMLSRWQPAEGNDGVLDYKFRLPIFFVLKAGKTKKELRKEARDKRKSDKLIPDD